MIIKQAMGILFFLLGFFTVVCGLFIILRKEYQEAMKTLAAETPKLVSKSPLEEIAKPIAQSSVQMLETINKLIQTAVGVGAFLCMMGAGLCMLAYWMVSN